MTSQPSEYYVFDKREHTQFLHTVSGQSAEVEAFLDGAESRRDHEVGDDEPVAVSPRMQQVLQVARRYADSGATILVTGESGTGKEVLSRFIHRVSARASAPHVRVNCAALSETLIESELFGHEKGAFTGADRERAGRFESAGAGTLLLDEITEIPLRTQAKLLRVLEEEEFQRVGSNVTRKVHARIIATSNRNLEEYVDAGGFRSDLYYRLNVLQIHLPPLRERREDILPLVHFFIRQFGAENRQSITHVCDTALRRLEHATWPGNIRQLRNVIHRACILAKGGRIEDSDLLDVPECETLDDKAIDFAEMRLDEIERHAILSNLRRFHGNKTATARHLGVTSRTLANKMKRYREMGWLS